MRRRGLALTMLVPLAAGLAAAPKSTPERRQARATATPTPRSVTVPSPEPGRWSGEPISLDLKDADLKDVLRTFAKLTMLNIAVDPEVEGSVTVTLHDVPWDQALDPILRMNGLGYVVEGNLVRVGLPAKLSPSPSGSGPG